ncbi:MAG: 2-amino-4-hydroxy-6-hydroxymethyldihydropteridine diphosphokinase [Candidatus Thermoplasmatota archaeon]|nr:2-amino-4-hydroxy-6-hydroxymethyldihydropteridine diphosphokinase [Candidatus Thermoplasmatota archaeon]
MTDVYLSLGSNVEPELNIVKALEELNKILEIKKVSNAYRTKPVDGPPQPDYCNLVVLAETDIDPGELKFSYLREIERKLGRSRSADRYGPRTIDIDIIIYGDSCIDSDEMRIPDPDIYTRSFLVLCLYELSPELKVPCASLDIGKLVTRIDRKGLVKLPALSHEIRKFVQSHKC